MFGLSHVRSHKHTGVQGVGVVFGVVVFSVGVVTTTGVVFSVGVVPIGVVFSVTGVVVFFVGLVVFPVTGVVYISVVVGFCVVVQWSIGTQTLD